MYLYSGTKVETVAQQDIATCGSPKPTKQMFADVVKETEAAKTALASQEVGY